MNNTLNKAIILRKELSSYSVITVLGVIAPLSVFLAQSPVEKEKYIPYIRKIDTIYRERGVQDLIRGNKSIRICFTRWISGAPILSIEGIRMSRHIPGLPFLLSHIVGDREDENTRFVLTLLTLTRAILGGKDYDDSAITDKYRGSGTPSDGEDDVFRRFKRRVLRVKDGYTPPHPENPGILTTKNGPSGHALSTSFSELSLIDFDIERDITVILGNKTSEHIAMFRHYWKQEEYREEISASFGTVEVTPKLAKIVPISDREGKTRVIAMGTYWVQCALNPIHVWCMRALKGIPEDCTYNQEKSPKVLRKEPGNSFGSFDLSSATDRFPLSFQKEMIKSLFGQTYADAWARLVTPVFKSPRGDVKYEVGQPIGFLSSWAVFSLAHHYVIEIAARRAGVSPRNNYVILGDDLVICNDNIAHHYKKIIESLGVEISTMKTHVSPDIGEFAKKGYKNGKEVSPFPILAFSSKHFTTILEGALTATRRGFSLGMPLVEFCSLVSALYTQNYGPGYLEGVQGKYTLYYSVYRAIAGYNSGTDVWNNLRYARRELSNMRPLSSDRFGREILALSLFVLYYDKGIGAIVTKTKEMKERFSGHLFGGPSLEILPASSEESELFQILPQARILERIKDQMLRVIADAETMEPQSHFETILGKNKDKPIGLLVSDLSTLFTSRTQPTNWTVMNSLIRQLTLAASRILKSGIVFPENGSLPDELVDSIFKPIVQYGDHVSADDRGDPIVSYYGGGVRERIDEVYKTNPVTPPGLAHLYEEDEKSHSAYYGADITFNW